MEELEEIKVTTTYKSQVMRGIELLELCQKLQSEKDGVDRPDPLSIVKSKKLDQFALDVERNCLDVFNPEAVSAIAKAGRIG